MSTLQVIALLVAVAAVVAWAVYLGPQDPRFGLGPRPLDQRDVEAAVTSALERRAAFDRDVRELRLVEHTSSSDSSRRFFIAGIGNAIAVELEDGRRIVLAEHFAA